MGATGATGPMGGAVADPDGRAVVLETRGISKRFGSVQANDRISLSLRRGEVLGVLGENGAGKSTLMNILYGLYSADDGDILVDGRPVQIRNPSDAVALGIGMVHQHFKLVPVLTVAENIVLGSEPRSGVRLDVAAAERATAELAERYGLRVDPRARVGDLSVGVQQRVEILKALHRDARILILDEPTAVLTPQETGELFATLRELVDGGLSVILITHKLGELLGVAERIMVIRDGAVVDTVPAAGTSEAQLARLMVGRDVLLHVSRDDAGAAGAVRLSCRDLHVRATTGVPAVRGVDLEVRAGEIVAIAGVDGNGQTELAEALAGMRTPESGTVQLDGHDVTIASPAVRRARGLAYIPEDRISKGLVPDFDLAENLALTTYRTRYSRLGWLSPRRLHAAARPQLRRFDVRPPDPTLPAASLSGGNQQKVVLARELGGEPAVIIAAQPTRGVDVGAIEFIHAQLLAQRAAGKAILLISLELEEIRSLADRILVLYEGRVVGEVAAEQATDEQLGLWMAGRDGSAGVAAEGGA